MSRVLITGGAGFVGRHFVRAFLERGDDVDVVDPIVPHTGAIHPNDGWPLFDPRDYTGFQFIQTDCRDFFKQDGGDQYDCAIHLAAVVGGRLMIERNPIAVADDLSIDAHFWQWAVQHKPRKVVCFSSSAAYPIKYQRERDHRPLTEDLISFESDLGMPDMTYGWAKLTCEYLARLAHERHGIDVVCYRPFSGYGEDQDDSYPFPSICKRVIANAGNPTITVWGSGRQMRDFIHIDDCVHGVLSTMDQISDGSAINLSTGVGTSFFEFAALAASIYGYEVVPQGTTDKPEGVFARVGDTVLQTSLGFRYSISFVEGVTRALRYFERVPQSVS